MSISFIHILSYSNRVFEKNGQVSSQSFSVGDEINAITQFLPNRMLTQPTFMDNLIRGLLRTRNERADNDFAAFITGQLFKYLTPLMKMCAVLNWLYMCV